MNSFISLVHLSRARAWPVVGTGLSATASCTTSTAAEVIELGGELEEESVFIRNSNKKEEKKGVKEIVIRKKMVCCNLVRVTR
ncbi:hypothetical protein B5X24_HaOG213961 [Helicoverpa armigera]|nr:hypothetical protein B5X24_HaOG213961 [Helicoverpa armigera]